MIGEEVEPNQPAPPTCRWLGKYPILRGTTPAPPSPARRALRALVVLLPVCGALALAGCAAPGGAPLSRTTPPDAAAAVADPIAEQLEEARHDYYMGVRAWVREDLDEAERLLVKTRQTLAFADDFGDFTEAQARDAETLRAKADYFLGKIDERLAVDRGTPVDDAGEEVETGSPAWEVVHGEITPVRNKDVDRWIRYFTGEGRPVLRKWLDRKSRYEPTFERAFAEHGLPPELTYHAMIESGFHPGAYSWAHAVGLWQFIRSTGRSFGLRSDWWVDERRDPVRSTEAAAKYMKALYVEFEDWELALAAYNVGEARVRRQIRRQQTRSFWKLRLPRETRNHVPKFYAAVIIGTDPEQFGFAPTHEPPPASEPLTVDFCVDFDVLGESAGVAPEVIADLNPSLVRRCTPPDEEGFTLLVPKGTADRAASALAALPQEERVRWAHHRVRRGDTLSGLAEGYRTSVRAIQEANHLKSAHFLSIGQDLLIPQGRPAGGQLPKLASSGRTKKIVYKVKSGDTLSEIAERHGTSSRMLRRWNRVGKYIRPGDRLTIHVDTARASTSGGGSKSFTVRVRRGDTLWDIARHHGITLQSLRSANSLERNAIIRPGDVLRIPRS